MGRTTTGPSYEIDRKPPLHLRSSTELASISCVGRGRSFALGYYSLIFPWTLCMFAKWLPCSPVAQSFPVQGLLWSEMSLPWVRAMVLSSCKPGSCCQRCCFPKVTFCYCIQTQVPLIPKPKLKQRCPWRQKGWPQSFPTALPFISLSFQLPQATDSTTDLWTRAAWGRMYQNMGRAFGRNENSHISHAYRNCNNPTGQNQQLWNLREANIPLILISIVDFTDRSSHWNPSEAVFTHVPLGFWGNILHIMLIKSVLRCVI